MSDYLKMTIVYPLRGNDVLLGHKRPDWHFGADKWNGFGGKLQGESFLECAIRELSEETGLETKQSSLRLVARLLFHIGGPLHNVCAAYTTEDFVGEPFTESREMDQIGWISRDQLPLDKMWQADRLWVPEALGRAATDDPLNFRIHYSADNAFQRLEVLTEEEATQYFES